VTTTAAESTAIQRVLDPAFLDEQPGLMEVLQLFQAVPRAGAAVPDAGPCVGNLWGSSQALVLAWLADRQPALWVAVTASESEAERFRDDLAAFGLDAALFPDREGTAANTEANPASVRGRLQVARFLTGDPAQRPRILVASLLSLLQPVPRVADLERDLLTLRVGELLNTDPLLDRLVGVGYQRTPLAEAPGEVSLRGDILDIFPFAADLPVRVECFDGEIESLRSFDPGDQRSVEVLEETHLCLSGDAGGIRQGEGVAAATLLPTDAILVTVEPLRVEEQAETLRIQSPAHERALGIWRQILGRSARLELQSLPGTVNPMDSLSVQALGVGMKEVPAALRAVLDETQRLLVLCQNEAEEHRFLELIEEAGGVPGMEVRQGSVSRGFRLPGPGLVLINHRELTGIAGRRRPASRRATYSVKVIQSFFDLKVGDLVVHATHGLARYLGLKRLERSGAEEEYMHLSFAEEVSLFVPASRIDLVQRYIGSGGSGRGKHHLDRLGASTFRKRKERVERGLFDLAAELIEVQALRATRKRDAWQADDEMVRDLVGSFPHEDTVDQTQVDGEIEEDLAGPRPMDRLLCGDVGFGKTELAVRAAFRVVSAGGKVAVLVPTTVLAQQHFETFSERLADFPVEIALLCRYSSPKETRETLKRLGTGQVDILIGTHRILSKDVPFSPVGLTIIDEEQRFGVEQKEHFKQLRASVDILTLTATPIPRTLHMSLSGLRDISALTVAPPGRQEIETIIGYSQDDAAIRDALLRERNRGGQVFFLHNRVRTIDVLAQRLQNLAPECSFAVAHGQMGARELRSVMDVFTRGDVDVLVATTIIENGLDIPTAGTIFIDQADRFGLSELHQLRGRVGRGPHKAWCYLLVEKHKPLRDVARRRLKALEELNRLGAGFDISVQDLEIRGAGNILGAQQSGHIAAVGYDMYCRLLRQTVESIQAGESPAGALATGQRLEEIEAGVEMELGLPAFLPDTWIGDANTRLEVLRELANIADEGAARDAEEMLRDRFGRIPLEATNLLRMFRLKARLDLHGLERFAWHGEFYLLEYGDRVALESFLRPLTMEVRWIRPGVAHLIVPKAVTDLPKGLERACAGLDWFEGRLDA
jgi:transcription-repair coupling factor (superfamily II helicase)